MEGDFATGYAIGQNDSKNNGGFGFGGDWWVIIILALLFGWGGNGWGGGGYGGGNAVPYISGIDTRSAVYDGFALNNLENGIRGVQNGLSDGFYAVNTSLLNGFHGVDNAICNLGYQTQQGFNTLGYNMKDCCCETQRLIERGFCDTNYNLATNTSNIVQAGHADTDRVIAKLDAMESARQAEKIEALRLENQTLKFQASQAAQNAFITANQDAQTAELIRRLRTPDAVPAYVVPNPNCCYGNPLGVGYAGYGVPARNDFGCGFAA